jgi:multidrug efflux pump subunit AcrB
VSVVVVQFLLSKNSAVAAQEVRDKVSTIVSRLPEGTDTPIMEKFDVDATPIMSVVVAGNRNLREVTEVAKKQIKERIETVQGVGAVIMVGGWERAVNVYVDPDRMAAYQISVLQVREALQKQNIEIPGGRVDQGNRELVLRTMGRMEDVPSFADLIVATYEGRPIRVRDIGRVENGVAEPRSRARLDDKNAVSLIVKKQSGTNVVSVVDAVKAKLAELAPGPAARHLDRGRRRSVALHQTHHRRGAAPPDPGRHPGGAHGLALHARRPEHADRVGRHPDLHHRDLHDDAAHGLHAQQRDDARPGARGRHRHRRRGRHPREHLPPRRGAR